MKNKIKKYSQSRGDVSKHFSYKKLLLALVEWNEESDREIAHDKWWEKHSFSYSDLMRIANLKLKRKH